MTYALQVLPSTTGVCAPTLFSRSCRTPYPAVHALPYTQGAGFGTAIALANGTSSPLGAAYAAALATAVAQAGCGGISNVLAGGCTATYP